MPANPTRRRVSGVYERNWHRRHRAAAMQSIRPIRVRAAVGSAGHAGPRHTPRAMARRTPAHKRLLKEPRTHRERSHVTASVTGKAAPPFPHRAAPLRAGTPPPPPPPPPQARTSACGRRRVRSVYKSFQSFLEGHVTPAPRDVARSRVRVRGRAGSRRARGGGPERLSQAGCAAVHCCARNGVRDRCSDRRGIQRPHCIGACDAVRARRRTQWRCVSQVYLVFGIWYLRAHASTDRSVARTQSLAMSPDVETARALIATPEGK